MSHTIKTERLILRPWEEGDLKPFAELNADPRVREYFPNLLSREESDQSAKRMSDHIEKKGWGFWAASLIETGEFIGFIGLEDVYFKAPFTPAVEIGWRLAFKHWGKGYATEGALAALKYGFETLKLKEIVSFTPVQNKRSRHVMEKIGMTHDPKDDFDHPKLPEDHPLRRHVLYKIKRTPKYIFKPYSKTFPQLFEQERSRIAPHLKNCIAIEHVGSTAVPGLGGKGIIDIAIAVKKDDMNSATKQLQDLGYEFRPPFSTPDRHYFIAYLPDPEEKTRRYHIHLTYRESTEWKDLIHFRDYLRNHPEALQEYAELKKQAATKANHDGEHYRKLKDPFFKKIHASIKEES
jgi:3-dehydroquinate dehydratase/shikimate dehydrogenase